MPIQNPSNPSTTDEILRAIRSITDPAEIRRIRDAIARQTEVAVLHAFREGDAVSFDGPRNVTITGTIERINRKSVALRDCKDIHGRTYPAYRVSPSLIRKAEF